MISGISVDDPKNRAYAQRMGVGAVPFPPPYKGSVLARCEDCEGAIYVGPELQKRWAAMKADGTAYRVLCLICASLEARRGPVAMLRLSGKRSELGE